MIKTICWILSRVAHWNEVQHIIDTIWSRSIEGLNIFIKFHSNLFNFSPQKKFIKPSQLVYCYYLKSGRITSWFSLGNSLNSWSCGTQRPAGCQVSEMKIFTEISLWYILKLKYQKISDTTKNTFQPRSFHHPDK